MNLAGAGRAFRLVGGPVGAPHLWFLLTDPDDEGRIVAVMVVTERPHTDKTVPLARGDHPFVEHDSNVDFGGARFFTVTKIADAVKADRCHYQEDMSPELLERVRRGLLESPRTIHAIADYCRDRF